MTTASPIPASLATACAAHDRHRLDVLDALVMVNGVHRAKVRAVLARLEVSLVAPVDPEAFVRQFADIAANAASPSRPPRWDEYTDEHRAVRVAAMHATLVARGIPVTPEAGK